MVCTPGGTELHGNISSICVAWMEVLQKDVHKRGRALFMQFRRIDISLSTVLCTACTRQAQLQAFKLQGTAALSGAFPRQRP